MSQQLGVQFGYNAAGDLGHAWSGVGPGKGLDQFCELQSEEDGEQEE